MSRRHGTAAGRALAALLALAGLALAAQAAWMPVKAALAQVLLERAFARALADGRPARPWPWADTEPVARLTLAGRSFVVLRGGSGQALAFGPGHLDGTPEAGEPGTAVIAAHRDTQFAVLGQPRARRSRRGHAAATAGPCASASPARGSPPGTPRGSTRRRPAGTSPSSPAGPWTALRSGPLRLIVERGGGDALRVRPWVAGRRLRKCAVSCGSVRVAARGEPCL